MLFDTHAHVGDAAFAADREATIERARAAGFCGIVDVGTTVERSRASVALAEAHDVVYAAVGIHPYDAGSVDDSVIAELRKLARHPKVVAIGETGIDYFHERSPRDRQDAATIAHLELAVELDLPVILHIRSSGPPAEVRTDAHERCLELLEPFRGRIRGISHCFSGDLRTAERFVELGFHISFAGNVTYKKAPALHEAAAKLPLDRLLIETDCPYLSPEGHRGARNEPAYAAITAAMVARLRGMSEAALGEAVTRNARSLFRIGT